MSDTDWGNNIGSLYRRASQRYAEGVLCAQRCKGMDAPWQALRYGEWGQACEELAAWLLASGVGLHEPVGLFADHGPAWLIADGGLHQAAAVVVPRGADITDKEIAHICQHAGLRVVIVQTAALWQRLCRVLRTEDDESTPVLGLILNGPPAEGACSLSQAREEGRQALDQSLRQQLEERLQQTPSDTTAMIIFTSSTTGIPKGVVLTHANLMSQLDQVAAAPLYLDRHDRLLSLLPVWHIFERTVCLYAIRSGASTWFTSPRHLAEDLEAVQPTFMASAPRVWETLFQRIERGVSRAHPVRRILFALATAASTRWRASTRYLTGQSCYYRPGLWRWFLAVGHALRWILLLAPHGLLNTAVLERIRQATGGCLRGTISGGGALPPQVDAFFNAIGIPIWEGYGMTEVPVIAVRRPRALALGSVGRILPQTELRIVDVEKGKVLWPDPSHPCQGAGLRGEVQVRGPQVTPGYLDAEDALTEQGWWRTGDLGCMSCNGYLSIQGRCKDTIVLSGGENVEPVPIEDALRREPLIDTAVVVGQDRKHLAALILPDREALAQVHKIEGSYEELAADQGVQDIFTRIVRQITRSENGFHSYESIPVCRILPAPFEVGRELTNLLKLRRHVIHEQYQALIASCYAEGRR